MHSPSDTAAHSVPGADPALWNPAAAAGWSIVFTPAFGAYLVMRNWETLGNRQQAAIARVWFCFSLGLLGVELLASAINERVNSESNFMRWVAIAYLPVWWLGAALPQAWLVRSRFGALYPRKGWDTALLAAVIAGTLFFTARACITFVFVALT
jgi:cytochrome bd-type quinol oxidase subunit 2